MSGMNDLTIELQCVIATSSGTIQCRLQTLSTSCKGHHKGTNITRNRKLHTNHACYKSPQMGTVTKGCIFINHMPCTTYFNTLKKSMS